MNVDEDLRSAWYAGRYLPEALGARCSECPLRDKRVGGPVPSELNPGAVALAIGEAPGEVECDGGRPFIGPSGAEVARATTALGMRRSDLSWCNAVECRVANNDMRKFLYDLHKENLKRAKENLPQIPSPQACCRPRLLKVLRRYRDVITLGQAGLRVITQGEESVMALRGGPIEGTLVESGDFWQSSTMPGHKLRILPTIHPAFVMRARRWTRAFRADLGKAWRWFNGTLSWKDPAIELNPSLERVQWLLRQPFPFLAMDYETDGLEPLAANARCLGVGTKDLAFIVGFLSIDGQTRFYPRGEEEAICHELRQWMGARDKLKVGHNAGGYDRLMARRHLGVDPKPVLDTLILHRNVESELPHSLAYCGSILTDVTAWKSAESATKARTDQELFSYCATDVSVTAHLVEPLQRAVQIREQNEVAIVDHKIQWVCAGMHELGLFVDQTRRREWDVQLRAEAINYRKLCKEFSDDPDLNPNSYPAIRHLLFEKWGLPVQELTELGEASTNDTTIRKLIIDKTTPDRQRQFLDAERRFRRRVKYRGTYVRKLCPNTEVIEPDDLSEDVEAEEALAKAIEEANYRKQKAERKKKYGIVLADGRVHSNWNATGAVSGRLSSSEPNMQNNPSILRDMIIPAPGNVFVGADMDQIELRFAAVLAGASAYLEAFRTGQDPHTIAALMISGSEGRAIYARACAKWGVKKAKEDPDWKSIRDFAKCVVGDTRVPVKGRGLLRIDSLAPRPTAGKTCQLSGLEVTGIQGQLVRPSHYYYGGTQQTIRVRTSSGHEEVGTGKHRLKLVGGTWRRLDEIKVGDRLLLGGARSDSFAVARCRMPINPWVVKAGRTAIRPLEGSRSVTHSAPGLPTLEIGPEVGYLLGALHGDGCVSDYFTTLIGLKGDGVVQRVEELLCWVGLNPWVKRKQKKLRERTNTPWKRYVSTPKNPLLIVTASSVAFVDFLARVGLARSKADRVRQKAAGVKLVPRKVLRVPEVIFQSPRDVVTGYLAGLFDTDGTIGEGGWSCSSKSRELLHDVKLLLGLFDLRSVLGQFWNAEYQRHYYRLRLNRRNSIKFTTAIAPAMACRRKVDHFVEIAGAWVGREDAEAEVVTLVEPAGLAEVHDLVVPDGHAFVANGLVNHNTFQYSMLYGALLPTVHDNITSTEDDAGNLIYLATDVKETRRSYDRWLEGNSEFPLWWERTILKFRQQQFLADPILGRKRDFLDGEDRNELLNFECQSGAAGLIAKATIALCVGSDAPLRFQRWGPTTGLVQQGHDALVYEVPENRAEWTKNIVTEAMTQDALGMHFSAEAKISRTWKKAG